MCLNIGFIIFELCSLLERLSLLPSGQKKNYLPFLYATFGYNNFIILYEWYIINCWYFVSIPTNWQWFMEKRELVLVKPNSVLQVTSEKRERNWQRLFVEHFKSEQILLNTSTISLILTIFKFDSKCCKYCKTTWIFLCDIRKVLVI